MKSKVLVLILILGLVFTFPSFSYAIENEALTTDKPSVATEQVVDEVETIQKEEVEKVVVEEPQQKEEVKQEESQAVKAEGIKAQEVTMEKGNEFTPFKVTLIFYYRNGVGKEVSQKASYTFKKSTDSWGKAIKYYEGQITKNNFQTVSDGTTIYEYQWKWDSDIRPEPYVNGDTVSISGEDYSEDTTLIFRARYNEKVIYNLNFYYTDNVANGSGSWSSVNGFSGYTHTFNEPADYEKPQYNFLYWEDSTNNEKKETGESKSIAAKDLTKDTTINYQATYEYQPALRVVYHYEDGTIDEVGDEFEPIDIYAAAPTQGLSWYYDKADETPIAEGTEAELAAKVVTTEKLDDVTIVDVYAKSKEEPVIPVAPVVPDKPNPTKAKTKTVASVEPIVYGTGDGTEVVEGPTIIKKNPLPLNAPQQNYWALLNLLFALATCILAFILIIFGVLNKRKEDEDIEVKNKWWARIISACVGILSLVVFFITENMNNPWIWVDKWTLLMAIIFIINIILVIIAKHKEEKEND